MKERDGEREKKELWKVVNELILWNLWEIYVLGNILILYFGCFLERYLNKGFQRYEELDKWERVIQLIFFAPSLFVLDVISNYGFQYGRKKERKELTYKNPKKINVRLK